MSVQKERKGNCCGMNDFNVNVCRVFEERSNAMRTITKISIVMIVMCMLLMSNISKAAFVGANYDVSAGTEVFGHILDDGSGTPLPDYPENFTDSYRYDDIYRANAAEISPYTYTTVSDAGWLVYSYQAESGNIINNVDLTVKYYVAKDWATVGLKIFWTTDYDGQNKPDETQWTDTGFSPVRGSTTTETLSTFHPNSNKFFIAYKMWTVDHGYYVILRGDKAITTTVPEPATIGLLSLSIIGLFHKRRF